MECRDIGDKKMWGNVERECQRGLVIGGLSCDRWGAQRRLSLKCESNRARVVCDQWGAKKQLSCTIIEVSYGRRVDKENRKGM